MGACGAGALRPVLAEARHGSGVWRRVHLPGPQGRDLLHRQERVDAGPLRLDVRPPLPCVRREGRVAGRLQELPGLHGEVLHQPSGRRAHVLHRHRGRQAPAPAPLLFLRGLLRQRQRRVLRRHRRQGVPGAGPQGLQPLLGSGPRRRGPRGHGPQDHPRDPHQPLLRSAHDHPQRHRHPAAGGSRAQG